MFKSTYGWLEKYVKKFVGRADIEDAMGRLDRLTQEEVRMASAQGLKATHDVDEKVHAIDDKAQSIDNKVQVVDDKVQGVDDKVQGVDDRMRDVDDKIDFIIEQVADNIGDQKRS